MSLPVSDEEFSASVKTATSMAELIRALNYSLQGATYRKLHKEIKRLGLDTAHWTGRKGKRTDGRVFVNPVPLSTVMVRNSSYSRSSLKRRLIAEGLLEYKCQICGLFEWMGTKLSLHIDHINGDCHDNREENIRLLCPNCHSLTPTYCGRNNTRRSTKCACGEPVQGKGRSRFCASCAKKRRSKKKEKANWPPYQSLLQMVEQESLSAVGRQLGVSATAVRKRLRTKPE